MQAKDVLTWNRRVSAIYAVGIWSMIASYAVLKYSGRLEDTPVLKKKEEEVPQPEDPNQVVYQTAHNKTIIVYKKDFVPYSTRISNFLKSFSDGATSEGSDKKPEQ